jgi:hypothetical protein
MDNMTSKLTTDSTVHFLYYYGYGMVVLFVLFKLRFLITTLASKFRLSFCYAIETVLVLANSDIFKQQKQRRTVVPHSI